MSTSLNLPWRFLLVAGLLNCALTISVRGEISATNRPFAGLSIFSEVRADPPTRLLVAVVNLNTPGLRVRVARGGPDPDGSGPWQTTLLQPTKIAAREHFDLVVNGDFFDARGVQDAEGEKSPYRAGNWAAVLGTAVTDGKAWSVDARRRPCLVVHKNHKLTIERLARPAPEDWEVIGGNTLLVKDGVDVAPPVKARHPRTAVGLDATGTKLILLVVDGRKPGLAVGMSYRELAAEMLRLGCRDALNLDGGGSSVMAVRDAGSGDMKILNQPTDGHERPVANVLGISVDRRPAAGRRTRTAESLPADRTAGVK